MFKSFSLENWLALVEEDAIEPELRIVDPHHHLWAPADEPGRGDTHMVATLAKYLPRWLVLKIVQVAFPKSGIDTFGLHNMLFTQYLSRDLINDFGGHNVVKSVCIEAQFSDSKAAGPEFTQVAASKLHYENSLENDGFPHAMVCHVDLRLGKERVAAALKAHKNVNPNLRGLRHQLSYHPHKSIFNARDAEKDLMLNSEFRGGLEAVQEAGLTFEVYCYHTQLEQLAELAKAFPDLTFMLDHVGQPLGIGMFSSEEAQVAVKKDWEAGIKAVSERDNVHIKLSGLGMPACGFGFESRNCPPTSDELVTAFKPYIEVVLAHFGVDRCMYASNFPVDRVSSSYAVLWNTFKKISNELGHSAEDKAKLFHDNALAFYRLDESPESPRV